MFCVEGAAAKRQHVCFGSNSARLLGVALAPAISEFVQGGRVSGIGGVGLPIASMMTMMMRFHDTRRIARGARVAMVGAWACAPPTHVSGSIAASGRQTAGAKGGGWRWAGNCCAGRDTWASGEWWPAADSQSGTQ